MKTISTILFLIFGFNQIFSQIMIHPNRGQWNERIAYKLELDMGEMLIENQGVTYNFYHWHHPHHCDHHDHCDSDPNIVKNHVVKTNFIGSQTPTQIVEQDTFAHYRNYFLGDDESQWKSEVHAVRKVTQKNIYPNIDLHYESLDTGLKYSFIVKPNTNPNQIQIAYDGADKIHIDDQKRLIVTTTLGEIIESKPIAWTEDSSGKKTPVTAAFAVDGNVVSFKLGSYNKQETLIIDPELAFSTFTGATSDNWGFTACPDNNGNLYAGGVVFGSGYPVTVGAFDTSFNGGQASGATPGFDISITKFSANGTANLYSTFLGGSRNEVPTSIVTNDAGELFVLSITSSMNFPTTAGVLQTTFAGGPNITEILYFSGSDIAITRFNAAGTALLASTYIGGSGNDGLNYQSNLNYNYGDVFRGEIIVDNAGSVYFASTTKSNNFPVASTQSALGGNQDAVYGKLPEDLSTLNFCRYYGGNGFETGNSIQMAPNGDLYLTGGTTTSGLNFAQGGLNTNYFGSTDAYVIRVNSATGLVQNGTYLGTNLYDQGYFVQTDYDNNVYVFGQARGNYPQSPGVYNNPNSGQFIHKLNSTLNTSLWSTSIGSGSGNIEISPTAFLVSNCYKIYIAGWGGSTNSSNSLATQSSTNGFPTTPGAHQQTTNGHNFYLAVLSEDAAELEYGTFIGGVTSSFNHVDGGTSRFSKEGTVYHAVCGSCGATNNGFTTTPGVWATTSASSNCNLAAFKFNLTSTSLEAAIGNSNLEICLPNSIDFINNSLNGNAFFWDFGDGNTSSELNPTHTYTEAGEYSVMLVALDSIGCFYNDTVYIDVLVGTFEGLVASIDDPVCPGSSVQLTATGGSSYSWSPGNSLSNTSSSIPVATVFEPTTYTVIISGECGSDTLSVFVDVYNDVVEIEGPEVICLGDEVQLSVNSDGMEDMQWMPENLFDTPNESQVTFTPSGSINVVFSAFSVNGCALIDEHFILVDTLLPVINLVDSVTICAGSSTEVTILGNDDYLWSDIPGVSPLNAPTVTLNPQNSTWFYVTAISTCSEAMDSLFVEVVTPNITAGDDAIVCSGESVQLWAHGGVTYNWTPQMFVNQTIGNNVVVSPTSPTNFTVIGTDEFGCTGSATVFVDVFPNPTVYTDPDIQTFTGDEVEFSAYGSSSGSYSWNPPMYLSCPSCQSTTASALENMSYVVTFTDENGCVAQDVIHIVIDAIIFLPNTFTPDQDQFNPTFKPKGENIVEFHMTIFNRWGEILFETYDFDIGWDGTYGGKVCPDGTYIWVIEYTDNRNNKERIFGHVNLLK